MIVRSTLFYLALVVQVLVYAPFILVASLFGVSARPGNIFDAIPRNFCRVLLRAAGVRVVVHNAERIPREGTAVYVSNHVSWFDIFSLASVLPHYRFIAKAELRKIPLFGPAAARVAAIYVDRKNRKAAFESYRLAAAQVREGASVVVCPEGTRGRSYELRPFKKGPFVLAIAAGVPIVPTVVFGAREIQPKGSFRVRPGTVQISILEKVSTEGLDYDDRDQLMRLTRASMAREFETRYGISSDTDAEERPGEFASNASPAADEIQDE